MLRQVTRAFGKMTPLHVPQRIENVSGIYYLMQLSAIVQRLGESSGFPELVAGLSGPQAPHNHFVAGLATTIRPLVDTIDIEPTLIKSSRRPDLKVSKGKESVFIECKGFEQDLKPVIDEHVRIASFLRRKLPTKWAFHFKYNKEFTDDEWRIVAETLTKRAPKITNPGIVLIGRDIKVRAAAPDGLGETRTRLNIPGMSIYGIEEDMEENAHRPLSLIGHNEYQIMLAGPFQDSYRQIRLKFDQARKQAPLDAPFLLAIESETLFGRWTDHLINVNRLFNPTKNTRISGVILTREIMHPEVRPQIYYVRNAFASHPLPDWMDAVVVSAGGIDRRHNNNKRDTQV